MYFSRQNFIYLKLYGNFIRMDNFEISKTIVADFCLFAKRRGFNLLEKEFDALYTMLTNPSIEMIPYHLYNEIYDAVLIHTEDEFLGFHEGEQYNMAALGIVGQLVQVSPNVGEAIQNSCNYFNLLSNTLSLHLIEHETTFSVVFEPAADALKNYTKTTKHLIYSAMVFGLKEILFLSLNEENPIAVEFIDTFDDTKELTRIFNAPIKSGTERNRLIFDKATLDLPIITANYELLSVLMGVACSKLKTKDEPNQSLSFIITQMIYKLLNPKIPNLKTIAQNLNMSERNLQRKLKEEGTTYSNLIESVKKKLVIDYLKKDLTVKEISFLMGYSEPTAFVSAFKKWYSISPGEFRKSI